MTLPGGQINALSFQDRKVVPGRPLQETSPGTRLSSLQGSHRQAGARGTLAGSMLGDLG